MNFSRRTYLPALLLLGGTLYVKAKPTIFKTKSNIFKAGKIFQENKHYPTYSRLLQADDDQAKELCNEIEEFTEKDDKVEDVDCVTCTADHIECDIVFDDECLYSDQQQKKICYKDEVDLVVDDPLSSDPVVELDGYIEYEGDLNGTTLTMNYTLPFMDPNTYELEGGTCSFKWNDKECESCEVGCDGAYGFSLNCSNVHPCAVTQCEISMEVIPHDLIIFIADIETMQQRNQTTCPPLPGVDYVEELCDEYEDELKASFEDVTHTSCPICNKTRIQCEADTDEECVKDDQGRMTDVCFRSEVDIVVNDPTSSSFPPMQEIDFLIRYTSDDLQGLELDLNYTRKADPDQNSTSFNDEDYEYTCSVAWKNVNCTSCEVEDDYEGITLDCSNIHRCAMLDMVDIFDYTTSYIIAPQFITFIADLERMDDNDACPPLSAVPAYRQICDIVQKEMIETYDNATCRKCTEDEIGCTAVDEEECIENDAGTKDVCYTVEMNLAVESPKDAMPERDTNFFIQYTGKMQGNNVTLLYEPFCSIEWNNETCNSCVVGCNGTQDGIMIDCSNIYPDALLECQEDVVSSYSVSPTLIKFFARHMDTMNESEDDVEDRNQKAARAYGILFTLLVILFTASLWIYCRRRRRRHHGNESTEVVVWEPTQDIHNQGQMA